LRRAILLALPLLCAACEPDIDDRISIVEDVTVLGIQSDPPEARPSEDVAYRVLVADPKGTAREVVWDFCNDRKPLAELGPVSSRCFKVGTADFLERIGTGPEVATQVPEAACRNFGPEVPSPRPGEPNGRPVDPDTTGGYFQPVRVIVNGGKKQVLALGRTRVACGIAGVTSEIANDYSKRYVRNANPALQQVESAGTALVLPDTGGSNTVQRAQKLKLHAVWPACTGAPCEGAEPYVVFDPIEKRLVDRRETIRLAWFATGGAFDTDRTGRAGDDTASFSENVWTAPAAAGRVNLWVVIRDDRGGQSWLSYVLDVQ
jgi:hypothetical protein